MWIIYAIASSFFAGITAILAKCGIRKTDSDVAMSIRTIVVFFFSWIMVFIAGTHTGISDLTPKTVGFLGHRGFVILRRCKKVTSTRSFPLTNPAPC